VRRGCDPGGWPRGGFLFWLLAREIARETAGNPFFAGELLRHLTESGAIVREDGGRWRVAGNLAELGLPQSVREVVGRRVERLGAGGIVREIAECRAAESRRCEETGVRRD
jgi:predicted ATPase